MTIVISSAKNTMLRSSRWRIHTCGGGVSEAIVPERAFLYSFRADKETQATGGTGSHCHPESPIRVKKRARKI